MSNFLLIGRILQLLIIIKAIWSSYTGKRIDGMYSEYKSYVTLCTSWVKRSFASTKGALKTCNREWSKKFSMEAVHRNQLHKYFRMLFCKVYLQAYSIRQVLPPEDQFLKTDDFSSRIIHNRIPVAALVGARSSWKKCFGLLWKWLEVSSQGPCDTHTALESNSSFAQQPLPTSNKCNSKYFVKQLCIEEKVNV